MKPISMISRNSGSFLNWLSVSGARPVIATQPASTASASRSKEKTIEILPGVTLDQLPVKPSRPPSAFNLFVREKMTGVHEKGTTFMKEVAQAWKLVPPQEKARYERQSKPTMDKYKQEMIEYNRFMTQKLTLTQVAEILKKSNPKIRTGHPRAPTGYNIFLAEALKGKAGKPDLKMLATEWNSLSPSEKQKWTQRAEQRSQTVKH